jgi:hypothetical protein
MKRADEFRESVVQIPAEHIAQVRVLECIVGGRPVCRAAVFSA